MRRRFEQQQAREQVQRSPRAQLGYLPTQRAGIRELRWTEDEYRRIQRALIEVAREFAREREMSE